MRFFNLNEIKNYSSNNDMNHAITRLAYYSSKLPSEVLQRLGDSA
ncbi:hypothetical protein BRO54_1498 [Geobacillus proteiniphilus]|uniref:Mobile element protein n=1 Tax=Geobacillus proteiniphilus TaxID=860353 RepID=A0A1Q5T308_9BACL|nr:hypothetical protein BRO54_1498 [Geobacillus proteiniphilus]